MTTTVVLVSGARQHPNPLVATSALADYVLNTAPGPVIVRHGDCPGPKSIDQAVAEWIRQCGDWLGVTAEPMPADWDHCVDACPQGHQRKKMPGDIWHPGICDDYCPAAGPRRNAEMAAKLPRAELLIAAPHGASLGTRGCIRLAKRAGIRVIEVSS